MTNLCSSCKNIICCLVELEVEMHICNIHFCIKASVLLRKKAITFTNYKRNALNYWPLKMLVQVHESVHSYRKQFSSNLLKTIERNLPQRCYCCPALCLGLLLPQGLLPLGFSFCFGFFSRLTLRKHHLHFV